MDTLSSNLKCLKAYRPELHEVLTRQEVAALDVIRTTYNQLDLQATDERGEKYLYYNNPLPAIQCETDIDSFEKMHESTIREASMAFVCGFGLGLHTLSLIKRYSHIGKWYIIEPSVQVLLTAIANTDLTTLFSNTNVTILLQYADLEKLSLDESLPYRKIMLFTFSGFQKRFPSYFRALTDTILQIQNITGIKAATCSRINKARISNILSNLDILLSSPKTSQLYDKNKGRPAICIAAGPSLDDGINELKRIQNHALLITCDAALSPCLRHGIMPDIITSTDLHPSIWQIFFQEYLDVLGSIPLIAPATVDHKLLSRYPGPIVIIDSLTSSEYFQTYLQKQLYLLPSKNFQLPRSNVGLLSLSLAALLGSSHIALVGQDLGFAGGKDYAGTAGAVGSLVQVGRRNYWRKQGKNGTETDTEVSLLPSNNGGTIAASGQHNYYKLDFEAYIKQIQIQAYNCSAQGTRIEGIPFRPLPEVAELLTKTMRKTALTIPSDTKRVKLQKVVRALAELSVALTKISSLCHKLATTDCTRPELLASLRPYAQELNILGEWNPDLHHYLFAQDAATTKDPDYWNIVLHSLQSDAEELNTLIKSRINCLV